MKIDTVLLGSFQVNCYLISTDKSAIVIDPGFNSSYVEDFLLKNADKERMILLTHAHFDHIGGALQLKEKTGVKIAIGRIDEPSLSDENYNLSTLFNAYIKPFNADILLDDGEITKIGDITLKTIHTPGHTKGSVGYLIENNLFSGDTLFNLSVGRTDFPGGNTKQLLNSVKKLFALDDNTKVFSGHGATTTIGYEKINNPYIKI